MHDANVRKADKAAANLPTAHTLRSPNYTDFNTLSVILWPIKWQRDHCSLEQDTEQTLFSDEGRGMWLSTQREI